MVWLTLTGVAARASPLAAARAPRGDEEDSTAAARASPDAAARPAIGLLDAMTAAARHAPSAPARPAVTVTLVPEDRVALLNQAIGYRLARAIEEKRRAPPSVTVNGQKKPAPPL